MWEYEGLFGREVDAKEYNMLTGSEYWMDLPPEVRIGQMGYRRRKTKAGSRLEVEIFPIFGRNDRDKLRKAKQNITRQAQANLNQRRSERRLIMLMEENFTAEDVAIGLDYDGEPPEDGRLRKDLRNFLARVGRIRKKRGLSGLKYIYAIGGDEMPSPGYSGKRPHIHIVMSGGIERDELERIWGHGHANTKRLQPNEEGLEGLAKYLRKQKSDRPERKNARSWSCSQNLRKPKARTTNCKGSNRWIAEISRGFEQEAKEVMEKLYKSYRFVKCSVYHSDVVSGVYIRCVMRKREGENDKARAFRAIPAAGA